MEQGRSTARARRAKQKMVKSLKETSSTIKELADERGWGTENKVFVLLRQQRGNEEIIDFYRSKRYGFLDKVCGVDFVVLVGKMDLKNLKTKLKKVPRRAKFIIKCMIEGYLPEKHGYGRLIKLSGSGVFQVVTFNTTSSNGTKFHKRERDRKKGRENPEPILVKEAGELGSLTLEKIRKIEGINNK